MKFLIKCNRICNFKLEIESIEGLLFLAPCYHFLFTILYLFFSAHYLFSTLYIKAAEWNSIDDVNSATTVTATTTKVIVALPTMMISI